MGRIDFTRRHLPSALVLGLATAITGCGGGDGSSPTPTPGPTNRAPTFTSASTASIGENSNGIVYTAATTDPDGDAVTITLSGGADASAFSFADGALRFVKSPNFDQPTDANFDNSYEVTLTAQDSKGASTSQTISVRVTNDREGISVSRLTSGLGVDAVIAARTRGAEGLIVVSQDGTVREFFGGSATGNVGGNVFKTGETGRVLAVAHFNGYGVAMLDIAGRGIMVRTIILQDSQLQYTVEKVIAAPSTVQARGTLFIAGDGFLFGALGDPFGDLAQVPTSGYGKLYRVQVDPFCGASLGTYCIFAELFGDGVGAPAAGGSYASRSFLLDRGTDQQNEVTFFNQGAQPLDFGWPFREGTFVRVANPPAQLNGPSITYAYGDGFFEGRGMTGGIYYSGAIAALDDNVLIADQSGKIFVFRAGFLNDGILHTSKEMQNRTADFAPVDGTLERPISIVRDSAQRVYILDGDGELFQVRGG